MHTRTRRDVEEQNENLRLALEAVYDMAADALGLEDVGDEESAQEAN